MKQRILLFLILYRLNTDTDRITHLTARVSVTAKRFWIEVKWPTPLWWAMKQPGPSYVQANLSTVPSWFQSLAGFVTSRTGTLVQCVARGTGRDRMDLLLPSQFSFGFQLSHKLYILHSLCTVTYYKVLTFSLFGWLVRIVAGSFTWEKSTADWFALTVFCWEGWPASPASGSQPIRLIVAVVLGVYIYPEIMLTKKVSTSRRAPLHSPLPCYLFITEPLPKGNDLLLKDLFFM